jgi:hypothetical protein
MGSGRETIEPRGKAHKPADSGVVVGKGARKRSPVQTWRTEIKQSRKARLNERVSLAPLINMMS